MIEGLNTPEETPIKNSIVEHYKGVDTELWVDGTFTNENPNWLGVIAKFNALKKHYSVKIIDSNGTSRISENVNGKFKIKYMFSRRLDELDAGDYEFYVIDQDSKKRVHSKILSVKESILSSDTLDVALAEESLIEEPTIEELPGPIVAGETEVEELPGPVVTEEEEAT